MKEQNKVKRDYNRHPLRVFLSYYKPHKHLFVLDLSCALLVALTDLAFPYISKLSMEKLLPEGAFKAFFAVMAALVGAYLIRSALYYVIGYWGHMLGVRIEADMRQELFAHMQSLSFSFFDKNRTGVLMSRITTDLFEITELAHHGPEDVFISGVTLLGAFIMLCTVEWRLALILFAILPIFVVFVVIQRGRMRKANLAVKRKTAEINAAVESNISGIRTAKAFAAEDAEQGKFSVSNNAFNNSKGEYYKTLSLYNGGMEFTMSIFNVVVIAVGGYFIMGGRMDYIDLITFSLYVGVFINPVRRLSAFVESFMQGMAGFSRFLELMRTEPDIQDSPDAKPLDAVRGDIEYKDVSFRYGDGPDVLSHVDLHVEAGTCLAVVGPSGGGKTTLCHLLPRFYDVTAGSVSIDGHDVRSVRQSDLRRHIGIIQQDVFLFAGTIRENIRYGCPEATDEEVVAAAVRAEVHREIMDLPDGYDTFVGERGVLLSGGQKQRISIARVFLKNPPVLILDEATSALDGVTEAKIQASLDELSQGRTCIIIAHRLSTIRSADKIAVVRGEHICEQGSHDELMAKDGLYAELYRAQAFHEANS